MSSAEYHQLANEPLEKVLSSLVEQRGTAVVKVETSQGHAALSIAEGKLRGAIFGEYKGGEALRRVLDIREGVYQLHMMVTPPPQAPNHANFKSTLYQPGGFQGTPGDSKSEPDPLQEILLARKRSQSQERKSAPSLLVGQRKVLSENPPPMAATITRESSSPPAAKPTSKHQEPVRPLLAASRTLGEKDTSLTQARSHERQGAQGAQATQEPPFARTVRSADEHGQPRRPASSPASQTQSLRLQFNTTHFSGTSSKVALAPSAAPAMQEELPVPSSRFAQNTLDELDELNSAIRSSSPHNDLPLAPEGIPSQTLKSTPKQNTAGLPKVGRYEILARLKKGGMGSVYLCRSSGSAGFRRLFAMKVLNIEHEQRTESLDELFREARVLAQMHHPNIVGIVDVGTPTEPYLVLDYVEGGSLHELCQASPQKRDPGKVVSILLDALAGIAAAHKAVDEEGRPLQVVHCDITPHNLLVGLDGACRVADFGIAHTHGAKDGAILLGKPGYVAPERLLRQVSDQRADLFSLGVVLYTALTGVEPFAAENAEASLRATLEREVVPPSQVGLCPPPCLDWICMKALARDPEVRFQTAEDMIIRLRKLAAREELLATPSEVAAWVEEALGPQIEATRRSARRNTPGDGVSEAPPPPEAMFAPMPNDLSGPPDSRDSQERTEALSLPEGLLPETGLKSVEIPGESPPGVSQGTTLDKVKKASLAAFIVAFLITLLFFPDAIRNLFEDSASNSDASNSDASKSDDPADVNVNAARGDQSVSPKNSADKNEKTATDQAENAGVVIPPIKTGTH